MLGSSLSAKVIKHLESKYKSYVINVEVSSKNGTSDLVACINGLFFVFEIKGTNDTVKALQDSKMQKASNAGAFGGYVRSIADVDDIIINKKKPKNELIIKKMKL